MADSIFRQAQETVASEHPKVESKEVSAPISNDAIETPYLDTPDFLDSYFGIGTEWHDRDANFYPEVKAIDSYFKEKIAQGEMPNSQAAIRQALKGMEKLNNLRHETRSVVKLEVLANYIEFLRKSDTLKSNLKRYAY